MFDHQDGLNAALGSGSKPDAEIEHVEAPRPFFGPEKNDEKCTVYRVHSNYPLIFSHLSTFLEVLGNM